MDNISGVKILVVEDNILNQRIVKIILQKLGAEITAASNGEEAIDLLNKDTDRFDIILMDLNMPVLGGYETAMYIRTKLKSNIPIIALTADNMKWEENIDFITSGINAGISKPFEIDSFTTLVMKLINERK